MNVKNRKCIRKLSLKSLYANRRRNLIAIFAIALTTLLFTSMFTIVLSLNASYETYQFRQVGGYAHGTFKDVSPEQAERIAAHPKVKAAGARGSLPKYRQRSATWMPTAPNGAMPPLLPDGCPKAAKR